MSQTLKKKCPGGRGRHAGTWGRRTGLCGGLLVVDGHRIALLPEIPETLRKERTGQAREFLPRQLPGGGQAASHRLLLELVDQWVFVGDDDLK